jgi:hypothetical protein
VKGLAVASRASRRGLAGFARDSREGCAAVKGFLGCGSKPLACGGLDFAGSAVASRKAVFAKDASAALIFAEEPLALWAAVLFVLQLELLFPM